MELPDQSSNEICLESNKATSRKDSSILNNRFLDSVYATYNGSIKFHIGFVIAWMVFLIVSPRLVNLLVFIISPLTNFILWFRPDYVVSEHFYGSLGDNFYRGVVGETFFSGFFSGLLFSLYFIGRYWRHPWRLMEFALKRFSGRSKWILLILITAFSIIMSLFLAVVGLFWYGLFFTSSVSGTIAPFQLALWSILASSIPYACLFFVFTGISCITLLSVKVLGSRSSA